MKFLKSYSVIVLKYIMCMILTKYLVFVTKETIRYKICSLQRDFKTYHNDKKIKKKSYIWVAGNQYLVHTVNKSIILQHGT